MIFRKSNQNLRILPVYLLLLLFSYSSGTMAAENEQPPFGYGTVSGFVTDNDTGAPIESAEVSSSIYTTAICDSNGFYTMTHLNGEYDLTASADGYEGIDIKSFKLTIFNSSEKNFALEKITDKPKPVPSPYVGTIYGFVIDAYTREGIEGAQIRSNDDITTTTLPGGFYSVMHQAGKFSLTATTEDYEIQRREFDLMPYSLAETNFYLVDNVPKDPQDPCFLAVLFGNDSREVAILRKFRDEILKKNSAGQEIILRYYSLSPFISELLEDNDGIKSNIKSIIKGIIPLIETILE